MPPHSWALSSPPPLGCAFPPSAFPHHPNQHQLSKTVLHRSVGNENLLCLGQSCEIHPSEVFFSPSPKVSCINAYILSAQINAYIFSAQVRSVSCSTESVGVRLCAAHLGNALQCCGEPGVLGSGLQRCSAFWETFWAFCLPPWKVSHWPHVES